MKKRTASLLLCVLLICSLLAGCMKNAQAVNFAGDIELGEDGIVKKELFEQLISENEIASICGKSGQYSYKWTVAGADVAQARDLCMAADIEKNDDGSVAVRLKSTESFGFLPTLSVTLTEKWDAPNAGVYDSEGGRLSPASVTGSSCTTLSFRLADGVFDYVVRADEEAPAPTVNAKLSDGGRTQQDKYGTDPVPSGRPEPVEPSTVPADEEKLLHCTISIDCVTVLDKLDSLDPAKLDVLPTDGIILNTVSVEIYEGESVFDVLQRVCSRYGIQLESSWTPGYNSAYVEGIGNLYEKDCGSLSGWTYMVNGWQPNYGCSRYALHDGDRIQWRYTCDLGADVGGNGVAA